jgi:hypothetical protein
MSLCGARPSHEQKCFSLGNFGHIGADFRDDGLSERHTDTMHGHQVHTADVLQVSAHLPVLGRILAVRASLGRQERRFSAFPLGFPIRANQAVGALDFGIAGLELGGVEVEEGQGLREHKQVLFPPGAGQRQGYLRFALLAAVVAQGRQSMWVTFSGNTGSDNAQPGLASDVAEDLGELDVHFFDFAVLWVKLGVTVKLGGG